MLSGYVFRNPHRGLFECLPSTCRLPSSKQLQCLSPLPSPPSLGPQRSKPILPLCAMTVWDPTMILTIRICSTDDLVWPCGGCRPSLVHIRVMGGAWMQKALPLDCLVRVFQQSHKPGPGYHGCGSIKGNREKFPKRKEKKRKRRDFLAY